MSLNGFNTALFLFFSIFYSYQIIYVIIVMSKKQKKTSEINKTNHKKQNKYGILISARNEEEVISGLLESIQNQTYSKDLYDIFVVADNCTDNTAKIAQKYEATVLERFNKKEIGKSYALDYLLSYIFLTKKQYDGFFVFDADNVLDEKFIEEMDKEFSIGNYDAITSYRNSKNYGSSWISAGYALWFLREAKWLSQARNTLGNSCMISGTGFLIKSQILIQQNGWKHHLLTEDIEFSVDMIVQGKKIGYAKNAVIYDEQPVTLKESWNQRLRWSKGFYQVLKKYWKPLMKRIFTKKDFSSYDALCTIAPAMILTILSLTINVFFIGVALANPDSTSLLLQIAFNSVIISALNFYVMLLIFAIITTISEWQNIYAPTRQKIFYIFTFPLFMFTYVPIALIALFGKVKWHPVKHSIQRDVSEIKEAAKNKISTKL